MKKVIILLAAVLFIGISCEGILDTCEGKGTLELTNKSRNTVQRIMINGVNYGTIDPGETKDIRLTPGMYGWQLVGISGGSGCSAAAVTITECTTQAFSCSN